MYADGDREASSLLPPVLAECGRRCEGHLEKRSRGDRLAGRAINVSVFHLSSKTAPGYTESVSADNLPVDSALQLGFSDLKKMSSAPS